MIPIMNHYRMHTFLDLCFFKICGPTKSSGLISAIDWADPDDPDTSDVFLRAKKVLMVSNSASYPSLASGRPLVVIEQPAIHELYSSACRVGG